MFTFQLSEISIIRRLNGKKVLYENSVQMYLLQLFVLESMLMDMSSN